MKCRYTLKKDRTLETWYVFLKKDKKTLDYLQVKL
nr:MAG TPA: hypothetical protein [Caudoviricetes sp.]